MKPYHSHSHRFILKYVSFCLAVLILFFLLIQLFAFFEKDPSLGTTVSQSITYPIIVIDAGHGGEDGGTTGTNGVLEKDLNLSIAKHLNVILRSMGFNTVMTRSTDVLLYDKTSNYHGQKKVQDLSTRRQVTEQYENALFISIHMNAFPIEKYHGLQVYYSPNHQNSEAIANSLQHLTTELLLTDNTRKIKPSAGNIYLLDRLQCPAVLVECGFLSNPMECELLSDETYQRKLALSIALSLSQYFSKTDS